MIPEFDYQQEAQAIRNGYPRQLSFCPAPLPYVGKIKLRRRRDGGYLIAVLASDGQAAQFLDGRMAMEVISAADVRDTAEDHLATALERAHQTLEELRLEEAFKLADVLRRGRTDEQLLARLRQVLAEIETTRR